MSPFPGISLYINMVKFASVVVQGINMISLCRKRLRFLQMTVYVNVLYIL